MNITNFFNTWIASNFKGLSAHTLFQFLCMEYDFLGKDYVSNMVYVDLYHVFIKTATNKEHDTFNTIKDIINSCAWLQIGDTMTNQDFDKVVTNIRCGKANISDIMHEPDFCEKYTPEQQLQLCEWLTEPEPAPILTRNNFTSELDYQMYENGVSWNDFI